MRRILISAFLGAVAPVAFACTCTSYEKPLACEVYPKTQVVFRGRVLDDNDPRDGKAGNQELYRFEVIESFKGLPSNTREVFIDPMSLTSCAKTYSRDTDYLLYLSAPISTLGKILTPAPTAKAPPALPHWRRTPEAPVFLDGGCSATRTIEPNDPDLPYLRRMSGPSPPETSSIFGLALQSYSWPSAWKDAPVLPGATITVRGGGKSWTAQSDRDGKVEFGGLPPGQYSANALFKSSTPNLNGRLLPGQDADFSVAAGGCANLAFNFESGSSISGVVRNADGKPAKELSLDVAELKPDGTLRILPFFGTRSKPDGSFVFSNIPMGRYVVGINLKSSPSRSAPFDATFIPGVKDASAATVFNLQPGEAAENVELRLPEPLPLATLVVEVLWPNGMPVTLGARASADWKGSQADLDWADEGLNIVHLVLPVGRSYEVHAEQLVLSNGLHAKSAPVNVLFERDQQTITIKLKPSGSR